MFQIQGLVPKLCPEETKGKMCKDVRGCDFLLGNFLICVALLRVTPFILKELDSM
ncbi:mitochondrial import receptor subunit TOM5 homolog [Fukomys damarensis]|uniref:Mitochondrial import receptor subunit TOM5 like protein n=1 Tax=Fukomys damarensis TaxID=885580 RepID=A0A091D0L7_FUKDA|nr:mitochondrial import receptor subunit TOM5 homolog [Fukomys damarensis]KFO24048.1 Mitochondrial import receptor subunit TOM5 like protein [Fukomys damarensis]